ncbi:hypothetical protein IX329_000728 [Fusobacterium necrophorum]|uniref:helix-turn-helix domain-containing protein n=1 Tax=Fusobacterium necrophorum TaxID=859 RepID=UPI0007885F68|nr:helix-turn-helix domain-containing protein [Fusobacterium necrophorum]KYM58524.1 hypothetical protein A2U09_07650 [Fusobacterium necrophorum subsp. funduliforme]MBR8733155.1 hypothetical protein [Fusobacterium necrophorum]MBR8789301.1 hypothetical protein [Fusobacterium necrophorum]
MGRRNYLLETEMTLKAKGLLALMLDLPGNYWASICILKKYCKESTQTIKKTLKELEEFGYLKIDKKTKKWEISVTPFPQEQECDVK